ncbi:DUF5713 family protein [Streptomyces sp. SPB074]|uniref:DUF5713 family protein n=1 Tax=Streptomyces sp. (strain SPB074) TaxID=465543 RepID=UPI00017F11F8|nr:DUF5713 family protein [Streptomyces sp. SPB074]EDY42898.1 conserved hypothetical protein [Streptomyces sp. SPB074]
MTTAPGNPALRGHRFLDALYDDDYFPAPVLDRGVAILRRLCARIEAAPPAGLPGLYALTHAATREFNALEAAFEEAGSEIETVAREEICEEFWRISRAYGFEEADVDELTAPREW